MKLETEHKTFIVVRVACQQNTASIIRELRETFGIEVPAATIYSYDIGCASRSKVKRMGAALEQLFHETRKAYREGTLEVPIANRINRLQIAQRNLRLAEEAGERSVIAALLKEARADSPTEQGMGGAETLRVVHVNAAGAELPAVALPLPVRGRDPEE